MEFKRIRNIIEIRQAQSLLYQVYVQEMKWEIEENNPSGLRVVQSPQTTFLKDNYDEHAFWFGVYSQERLVASWRLCPPLHKQFELEQYHTLPELLKRSQSLEITRLVIHRDYRRSRNILTQLAIGTAQSLDNRFDYAFATAQFPNPGQLYLRLGAEMAACEPFKYSARDEHKVSLIYFNFGNPATLLSKQLQRLHRRSQDGLLACTARG